MGIMQGNNSTCPNGYAASVLHANTNVRSIDDDVPVNEVEATTRLVGLGF